MDQNGLDTLRGWIVIMLVSDADVGATRKGLKKIKEVDGCSEGRHEGGWWQ